MLVMLGRGRGGLAHTNTMPPLGGWDEPIRTLVPLRQGFMRHPTRNKCMGWFAQIPTRFGRWLGQHEKSLSLDRESASLYEIYCDQ